MPLRLTVLPPDGKVLASDLVPKLRRVLLRAHIPFEIEEASGDNQCPSISITDPDDDEVEFLIRLLQRAGYDVEIEL